MNKKIYISRWMIALLLCFLQAAGITMYAQDQPRAVSKRLQKLQQDSILNQITLEDSIINTFLQPTDSLAILDSIAQDNKKKLMEMTTTAKVDAPVISQDSLQKAVIPDIWVPNPVRATWMALVFPGGGQIYNRKYWKLPIFYGGFAGCSYALTWNNKMYKDYSQAYRDASNGNFTASSIVNLLPPGYIDRVSKTQIGRAHV